MNSIFVTGVGGFIGRRLGERALERGWAVSGVDLSEQSVAEARKRGMKAEVGDIADRARMQALIGPVSAVVHTAAIVRESGALELFRRVNVEGSVGVARAARAAGARTFVQLSSVMVYGFDFPPNVNEGGPLRGEGNPYCQTKIESEAAVLALNDPESFRVVVIRPGDVYGPGSIPWIARPLQMMKKGRFVLPSGGGVINHVYVDNLVDAILLALERRPSGEIFNVTDGVATTNVEFFSLLAARAGLPRPRVLPGALMRALAGLVSTLRRVGLTDDEASAATVRYLERPHAYSIEKARRDLGYAPRIGLEAGFDLTQSFIDSINA